MSAHAKSRVWGSVDDRTGLPVLLLYSESSARRVADAESLGSQDAGIKVCFFVGRQPHVVS